MKQSVVLIGACVAVLVGAWLASRALSADVVVPSAPAGVTAPVVPNTSPSVALRELPPVQQPPPPAQPTIVATPESPTTPPPQGLKIDPARLKDLSQTVPGARPPPEVEPSDEALSPFAATESPELDYAEKLLAELDGGVERLLSARDVFARCVDEMPALQRCQDGLAAVQLRLGPGGNGTVRPDIAPMKRGNLPTAFPTSQPKSKPR